MESSPLVKVPDLLIQDQKAEQLSKRSKVAAEQLTDDKRKQLKKLSQDFESLFTGMMLKSMRATVHQDKLTGGGNAEETYRSLLDQEYAVAASKRGGTGSIASLIEKELLKQYAVPTRKITPIKGEEQ